MTTLYLQQFFEKIECKGQFEVTEQLRVRLNILCRFSIFCDNIVGSPLFRIRM